MTSAEVAGLIRTRVLMAARTGEYGDSFGAAERWAVQRLRALKAMGEEAGLKVSWYTKGRNRHFGIEVRRADGTLEPAPTGPAETLRIGPYQAPDVSAQTAAEEKRKRKAEKLARLADKGALKRCT